MINGDGVPTARMNSPRPQNLGEELSNRARLVIENRMSYLEIKEQFYQFARTVTALGAMAASPVEFLREVEEMWRVQERS